ncbi:N-acetylmuramoyl-L-alanine amidase [Falsibacillus pallidus]|uniref:N-acetylmuramoyl-L-alanine amidase n=1 Tax=Falsibacillus pallidus TaxID=493781 RepID=A0A370GF41_9BACI|nr:peptidoglycan recognition family protein [Falsibacillus pallidus]RDI41890.1 N-acetylmuramoyl-L-alanine amidase [Falsibacillus pallidus]
MKRKWNKAAKATAAIAISTSMLFPLASSHQAAFSNVHNVLAAETQSVDSAYLQEAFKKAAKEFGVPENILLSVSYNMTRWEQHNGKPSTSGGYGVMHLTQMDGASADEKGLEEAHSFTPSPNLDQHMLDEAAKLINQDPEALKKDALQNIRGAAALLAKYAKESMGSVPKKEADWYGAVAKYSGSNEEAAATDFADQVYATIQKGMDRHTPEGQDVQLKPENIAGNRASAEKFHFHKSTKDPRAEVPNGVDSQFIPAFYQQLSDNPGNYTNYDVGDRPKLGGDIRYIVIHDTETEYQPTINLFSRPYGASAHYVLRSSDGQITQMIQNKDVAWHAGNWYFNMHSIGVEHEGYAAQGADWYSEQMYHASAKLVRYLAEKYDIPMDRAHIFGHNEVPGLTPSSQHGMHWDPGPFWDWDHYFELMGAPVTPAHGSKRAVTFKPHFETNKQVVDVNDGNIREHSTNFVYLYQEPSFDAPTIVDPAMSAARPDEAANWGNKAEAAQTFALADSKGDWDAIWYGGQKAWFYNPHNKNTVPGNVQTLITPKEGKDAIPVYGSAWPEASAYPSDVVPKSIFPLQYTIEAGQVYAAEEKVNGDYYNAKVFTLDPYGVHKMVYGKEEYYRIHFNHRFAFVKAEDVDVVKR